MTRKLAIDMRELTFAFEHSGGTRSFLDLETGAITQLSEDIWHGIEDVSVNEEDEGWEVELLREAIQIWEGLDTRYLEIPQVDSHTSYDDMVDFIETVEDHHLQELLAVAIRGKGAFRRFKDVLLDYPEARERWFQFKDEQMQQRALRWLTAHDIELDRLS